MLILDECRRVNWHSFPSVGDVRPTRRVAPLAARHQPVYIAAVVHIGPRARDIRPSNPHFLVAQRTFLHNICRYALEVHTMEVSLFPTPTHERFSGGSLSCTAVETKRRNKCCFTSRRLAHPMGSVTISGIISTSHRRCSPECGKRIGVSTIELALLCSCECKRLSDRQDCVR